MSVSAKPDFSGTGALLIVLAMAAIGLIDTFVLEIARHAGLWQFHAVRAAMVLPVLIVAALMVRGRVRPRNPVAVFARTISLTSSMMIYFAAIPMMPISLVVAGLFTAPCFVLIFSVAFFGTRVSLARVALVTFGFGGVLLILNPGAGVGWSFALPVLAGALYALSALTTRHYCPDESTVMLLIAFFAAMALVGAAGLLAASGGLDVPFHMRGWLPPTPEFLFWCGVQAVGSIFGVFLLTRAYQIAEPSYLAVFEYTLLVFASFWAWLLYGQNISGTAQIGIAMVVLSGVAISLIGGAPARRRRTPRGQLR